MRSVIKVGSALRGLCARLGFSGSGRYNTFQLSSLDWESIIRHLWINLGCKLKPNVSCFRLVAQISL